MNITFVYSEIELNVNHDPLLSTDYIQNEHYLLLNLKYFLAVMNIFTHLEIILHTVFWLRIECHLISIHDFDHAEI